MKILRACFFLMCVCFFMNARGDDTAGLFGFCIIDNNTTYSTTTYTFTPKHVFYNDASAVVAWGSEGAYQNVNDISSNYFTKKSLTLTVKPHPLAATTTCAQDYLFLYGQDSSMGHNTQVTINIEISSSSCSLDPSPSQCDGSVTLDTQRVAQNKISVLKNAAPYPSAGPSCAAPITNTNVLLNQNNSSTCNVTNPSSLSNEFSYNYTKVYNDIPMACYYIIIPKKS